MNWELNDVEQWLISFLETAVGHDRVYNSFRAARGAHNSAGFIVFRFVPAGGDVRGQGPRRIMSKPLYDITVVTKGSPTDESEAMVNAMDEALSFDRPVDAGNFRISVARLNSLSYESPGSTPEEYFCYRGGTYQLWVSGFSDN